MKQILVLGAGQSSPYLISYLLRNAEENDWFVSVGDIDLETKSFQLRVGLKFGG